MVGKACVSSERAPFASAPFGAASLPRPSHLVRARVPRRAYHLKVHAAGMTRLNDLLANNKAWYEGKVSEQGDYFSRFATGQAPEFLWIGCADSRVVGNDILGMSPGDVFTHRNVGNVVSHSDMNCMSVLDYGIGALGATHVIVCGHYGCGAVKASLTLPPKTGGIVNGWISNIRNVRNKYSAHLQALPEEKRPDLLSELNALEQMINVCSCAAVQAAWAEGKGVFVHCVVYDVASGQLTALVPGVSSMEEILAMPQFQDGIVSGNAEIKADFDASVRGLLDLEMVAA